MRSAPGWLGRAARSSRFRTRTSSSIRCSSACWSSRSWPARRAWSTARDSSGARRSGPWLSVAANRLLTGVTNVLYGASLTDMETCYKIMRADVARSLGLEANRFDIEPQITARLLRAGHHVTELPVRFEARTRPQGKKIGWRDGVQALNVLVAERFRPRGEHSMRRLIPRCSWRLAAISAALVVVAAVRQLRRRRIRFLLLRAPGRAMGERTAARARAAGARRAVARRGADVRARRARAVADGAGRHRSHLSVRPVAADGAGAGRRRPRGDVSPWFRCAASCWSWPPISWAAALSTRRRARGGRRHRGQPDRPVSGDAADERRARGGVLGVGLALATRARQPGVAAGVCGGLAHPDAPQPRAARFVIGVYLLLRPGTRGARGCATRALRHRVRRGVPGRARHPAVFLRLAAGVGVWAASACFRWRASRPMRRCTCRGWSSRTGR